MLNDELGDSISGVNCDTRIGVGVVQDDLDFAAISGIDCSGRIQDRQAFARCKSGARVNETRVPVGNLDGDPGSHEGPSAGSDDAVLIADQIRARIIVMRTHR